MVEAVYIITVYVREGGGNVEMERVWCEKWRSGGGVSRESRGFKEGNGSARKKEGRKGGERIRCVWNTTV